MIGKKVCSAPQSLLCSSWQRSALLPEKLQLRSEARAAALLLLILLASDGTSSRCHPPSLCSKTHQRTKEGLSGHRLCHQPARRLPESYRGQMSSTVVIHVPKVKGHVSDWHWVGESGLLRDEKGWPSYLTCHPDTEIRTRFRDRGPERRHGKCRVIR